jgi:DHA2 family multidrug resistance protein-like MFS transporter
VDAASRVCLDRRISGVAAVGTPHPAGVFDLGRARGGDLRRRAADLSTDIVVGSAPPERAGSAASLSETSAEFAFALGIAVLGSLGTAVYRAQIAASSAATAGGDLTRDSLAGAVAVAATLPVPLDGVVLSAAREAFTSGLHVVAATSGVVLLGVAVLALTSLRGVGRHGALASSAALPATREALHVTA